MAEYLQQVRDKEGELQELYNRMDTDKELAQLAKYVMINAKDKPVPDVVNVTLNKPAVFLANVESALNNAIEQVSIVTEDNKVDKDHIADCVRAGFASANSRLRAQGKFPINPFIDQQMCRRGRGAARVVFQTVDTKDDKGKTVRGVKPDISLWDSRFVASDIGEEGGWGSYRTIRSKGDIEKEWPPEEYPGVKVSGKSAEVVDYWNNEANVVYIGGKQVFEQPNPFGYPPICTQIVTLGSMLADSDALKYQGESIFFLIRDCIPELNRLLSIMQTLNMIAIKPPKGWASKEGLQEAPEYNDVIAPGSITTHEIGGGVSNIDFGDLKNATIYALNVIDNAIKQGSLEIVDVGNLPGPMSAVALIQIGEGRDQVFLPRLASRGLLNQQIADMFLRQIMNSGESTVLLGTKGRQRTFNVVKLQGAYEVEFNYFVKSPKIDIARYSVAQVAERYLDEESILKDVLQLEDPDGVLRRKHYDLAAKLSPLVQARRIIKSLSDMDDDDALLDAEILAADMGLQVEKVLAGEMTTLQQPEQPKEAGQPLLPLMNEGSAAGSARKAAQLQATPQEGE